MKKIRIGVVLSVVAIFMASCSLGGGGNNSYLGVYPNAILPKAIEGTSTFKVYHTNPVKLSIAKGGGEWCTVSPTSIGSPANDYDSTLVTVTYTANKSDKARQTEVLLNAADLETYVIVKQEANTDK